MDGYFFHILPFPVHDRIGFSGLIAAGAALQAVEVDRKPVNRDVGNKIAFLLIFLIQRVIPARIHDTDLIHGERHDPRRIRIYIGRAGDSVDQVLLDKAQRL